MVGYNVVFEVPDFNNEAMIIIQVPELKRVTIGRDLDYQKTKIMLQKFLTYLKANGDVPYKITLVTHSNQGMYPGYNKLKEVIIDNIEDDKEIHTIDSVNQTKAIKMLVSYSEISSVCNENNDKWSKLVENSLRPSCIMM